MTTRSEGQSSGAPAIPASTPALTLRRKQRLTLPSTRAGHAWLIESGCLVIEAELPGNRRQIVLLLYPGDIVAHEMIPPGGSMITAVAPSVLRRMERTPHDPPGTTDIATAIALQLARTGLHCITLGRLTGEERVATVLLEMAFHLGREVTNGRAFELPLSRRDLADYLALNPDTLSRIVSRFKAGQLISPLNRRQMLVTDLERLSGLSPLKGALTEIQSRAAGMRTKQVA